MKRMIVFLLTVLFALGLAGCTVPEPSVTPDPENENVWLCDGAVPKPDRIHVYRNGERNEDLTEEEFQAIWSAVNQLFNARNFRWHGCDCVLRPEDCEAAKETDFCMEFLYDGTYRLSDWIMPVRGMFFEFDNGRLFYCYYTLDPETGELSDFFSQRVCNKGEGSRKYQAIMDAALSALGQE